MMKMQKAPKRATKSALKDFHRYLKGKKQQQQQQKKNKKTDEPQTKDTLANVLKLFHEKLEKGMALPIQRAH